ncbi:transmembrane protein 263-like [Ruditapes philippinarum]|uniref:transmembrane protein 263-like n=1 Tax=Ruditapes philippinarum TaxID=129788 RepID=UPI00295BA850|nr:transmembrane protein 263-like [Ruditapes philippinarum]
MASLYQTVKACIVKTPPSEQVEFVTKETEERVDNPEFVKETDAQDFLSNKKTDEQSEQKAQAGVIWRVSSGLGSGLYNVTTGAVGYGVGSVKWVAGKSYDVGTAVASHVKVPSVPLLSKKKDKKE